MTPITSPQRLSGQRVRRLLLLAIITVVLVTVLVAFGLGVALITGLTLVPCGGGEDPAVYGLPADAVTFPSSEFDTPTNGYFIPGAPPAAPNGAIIVVSTGSAARGHRLDEVAVYHRAGYHVLTYDTRRCVGARSTSLGYLEAVQVGDALRYLQTRGDIDPTRIGVHGFSAGGAAATMAAAMYPEIGAVVTMGGYENFWAHLVVSSQQLPPVLRDLFELGVRVGYRVTVGEDISVLNPLGAIPQVAPRPILLIYGSNEPALPGARRQLEAAGGSASLWVVEGAGHGGYLAVAGEEYERRVVAFFDAAFGVVRNQISR